MTILAFDTSGKGCSAAVGVSGLVMAHRFAMMERGQSEALIPMIVEVMEEAQIEFKQLSQVLVTTGPGAFTGLRIGLAAAKALSLSSKAKIRGISTFMAVALGVELPSLVQEILIAIDSKRAEIFFQRYSLGLEALGEPFALLPNALPCPNIPTLIAGDGAAFLGHLREKADIYWQEETIPNAKNMVAGANRITEFLPLSANYLRAPDVTIKN